MVYSIAYVILTICVVMRLLLVVAGYISSSLRKTGVSFEDFRPPYINSSKRLWASVYQLLPEAMGLLMHTSLNCLC